MVSHNEWYQQRYQSAKGKKKHLEALNQKKAKYEGLKIQKQLKKQQNKNRAEIVFAEHEIPYQVVQKGVWLVNVDGKEIYFYPTTNRWRVKGTNTTYNSLGAQDFLGKVCRDE